MKPSERINHLKDKFLGDRPQADPQSLYIVAIMAYLDEEAKDNEGKFNPTNSR